VHNLAYAGRWDSEKKSQDVTLLAVGKASHIIKLDVVCDHQTQVTAEDTSLDIAFVQARMYTSKPLGVSTVQCCVPFLERVWIF
jgi:hypothetical protein